MACVITAPSSSSGKTLLSLLLISWARFKGLTIQPFKVGPDYLDPQILTATSQKACRNLDLILSNRNWVQDSFYKYGGASDFTLIEGVMGLFDGVGSTERASTAEIATELDLPIVLTINARGQAASLAPLVKGFRDQAPHLRLAGVVLNQVNTERHRKLLEEVLDSINVKVLGSLPIDQKLSLPSRYLGLIPAHEINDLEKRIESWSQLAEKYLDLNAFQHLLKSPSKKQIVRKKKVHLSQNNFIKHHYPIALAEDNAFHFRYAETKEYLEDMGMPLKIWKPSEDQPIPSEAKGLIIPGGFPEQFAKQLSQSSRSLKSIKSFYGKCPIYAECGGMLLLGESIQDLEGKEHKMAGLLPFKAVKGSLKVGYRQLKSLNKSLILRKGDELNGHEFHNWQLERIDSSATPNSKSQTIKFNPPWEISGWGIRTRTEGWSNRFLHASWIHLHWPSSSHILDLWLQAVKTTNFKE